MTIDSLDRESASVAWSSLAPADQDWILAGPRGLWSAKLGRILRAMRDPAVAIPLVILLVIVIACFFVPLIVSLPDPTKGELGAAFLPIGSKGHILGTNSLGNDVLSRLLYGGRVSLVVGLGATSIGMLIGTVLGMTAGHLGGVTDAVIMRGFDTLLAFPGLILALAIATFLGASERNTIIAISILAISTYGRLSRSQALRIGVYDYIACARGNGARPSRIVVGHILPNALPPLLAFSMITIGNSMLIEAGLSFLGLGITPPRPSWGNMIADGYSNLQDHPSLVIIPIITLFLTVLSLNLISDGLRRRLAQDR